jgi:hypothetical protein
VCPLTGEAAAPPRLRWSSWPSEVGWTSPLCQWVGMVPVSVRVSVHQVAMLRWCQHLHGIRSLRALPHLDCTLLQCWRRVRGGGVRPCRVLYRSPCRLISCCPGEAAMLVALYVKDAAMVEGVAAGEAADRARASLGDRRWRASICGRRSSGCIPARYSFNDGFNPPSMAGVYCSSLQSCLATGLFQIWAAPGDLGASDGWRWSPPTPTRLVGMVARDLIVISVFFRGFYAISSGHPSLYPVLTYLYPSVYVCFPCQVIQVRFTKKKTPRLHRATVPLSYTSVPSEWVAPHQRESGVVAL